MSLTDALLLDPLPLHKYIAWRTDGIYGSGNANDPWNGSTQEDFDRIMKGFNEVGVDTNVVIHIGPGTFQTRGFCDEDLYNSWQLKPGMRIIGASMAATIIQVVTTGATSNAQHYAMGHELSVDDVATPVDGCEVSDLPSIVRLAASTLFTGQSG